MTQTRRLHLIGNAHIDPVWLWTWEEGCQEVLASFRSALDRMKEFPDFRFSASSAVFYKWVKEIDPAMFAEIRQRVDEGRWELTGGWWVEPDCNAPGGESLARHALYGQRWLRENLGRMARTGFNIDSFGHPYSFPQVLRQSGLDSYCFLRPGPHERDLPGWVFWWEGEDGARVRAVRIPFTYCHWDALQPHVERCLSEIHAPLTQGTCWFGVGNHGGGPTISMINQIHELQKTGIERAELEISTPGRFLDALESEGTELPVVREELLNHAKGCYSVHSGIKLWNRQAEAQLGAAEAWASVGAAMGWRYPAEDFREAWQLALFQQFHDSLAGTSLPEAYESARSAYGLALTTAEQQQNLALQRIAWQIQIPQQEGALPLVAFNPLPWEVDANLELESSRVPEGHRLLDEADRSLPWQKVQSVVAAMRERLSFNARIPALGYRTFRLAPAPGGAAPAPAAVQAGTNWLENETLRLELDPENGTIISLRDKRCGLELLAGAGGRAQVLADGGDTWAHGVDTWDDEIGSFGAGRLVLAEQGAVKATLRAFSSWGKSELVQEFTLYPQRAYVDVRVRVNWQEQYRMLKLRFPTAIEDPRAARDYAFGWGEIRNDGSEFPMHTWADLSGSIGGVGCGLSVANDGKNSLDVRGADLGLTVLRSPIYAHHIPDAPLEGGTYEYIDQGWQEFQYRLIPHAGDLIAAGTVQLAAALNQPPYLMFTSNGLVAGCQSSDADGHRAEAGRGQ